ncbi:MAG: RNA-directed DNA polymerase [Burkholderiaceae bacterium]|nr:RNA-directed DNA polymerase [Burkholderiaceae bacterium]
MTVPPTPAKPFIFEHLLEMIIEAEWFDVTKEKLGAAAVMTGLMDYGLFADKVPPCFTSVGLAAIASVSLDGILEEQDNKKLKECIDQRAHDYIRYEALRDINIPRHLGIPHPEAYAVQSLAISRHWKEIATHCNQPNPAISRIHVRHTSSGSIFEMNYKGAERYQLEEDEIRWMAGAQYVVHADVASCFPSIYTHSIPWALHGKPESKKSTSLTALAGNLLDKCTQNTRDKQTNGVLIGPHSSNIISEVILTKIDVELQAKGHKRIARHIDDYTFYADDLAQAEMFVKDLGMCLRGFEMSLNDKKTQILSLPRPSTENWIQRLNRFVFPKDEEVRFSTVRSYLDLALECAQTMGKSTPLNYAIKALANPRSPCTLNERAKRLYVLEAINLALAYPYLAPQLDKHVFDRYGHDDLPTHIAEFSSALAKMGLRKLYPDAIAHALYYVLKHSVALSLDDTELKEIVALDDCIANVLLLEYATRHKRSKVVTAIKSRANEIKAADSREKDKNWLLIYQLWTVKDLNGNGQGFLAELKTKDFKFLVFPEIAKAPIAPVAIGTGMPT